jgi:hypothetical protein
MVVVAVEVLEDLEQVRDFCYSRHNLYRNRWCWWCWIQNLGANGG